MFLRQRGQGCFSFDPMCLQFQKAVAPYEVFMKSSLKKPAGSTDPAGCLNLRPVKSSQSLPLFCGIPPAFLIIVSDVPHVYLIPSPGFYPQEIVRVPWPRYCIFFQVKLRANLICPKLLSPPYSNNTGWHFSFWCLYKNPNQAHWNKMGE